MNDNPQSVGARGRTRTYEVTRRPIYSRVLLLLSHTCGFWFFELCLLIFELCALTFGPYMQSSKYRTLDRNSLSRFHNFYATKKQMKAERTYREHTSRHTSPEDGDARHSRKATASSSGRLPAFIQRLHAKYALEFFHKQVLRLSKNKKSGLQASQGSCPLLTILAIFL